jgi:hypothetical protein
VAPQHGCEFADHGGIPPECHVKARSLQLLKGSNEVIKIGLVLFGSRSIAHVYSISGNGKSVKVKDQAEPS